MQPKRCGRGRLTKAARPQQRDRRPLRRLHYPESLSSYSDAEQSAWLQLRDAGLITVAKGSDELSPVSRNIFEYTNCVASLCWRDLSYCLGYTLDLWRGCADHDRGRRPVRRFRCDGAAGRRDSPCRQAGSCRAVRQVDRMCAKGRRSGVAGQDAKALLARVQARLMSPALEAAALV
jgi:hypothetical protein